MDKKRLIWAFFIGMLIGVLVSGILTLFGVELGTWLGLLAFAVYMVAGYFATPWVQKMVAKF